MATSPPPSRRRVRRARPGASRKNGFLAPARRQGAPVQAVQNRFDPDPDARYVVCPASGYSHDGVAVKVTRDGPKRCPTYRCPVCRARGFLSPSSFPKGMGMTAETAAAHDLMILEY